LRSQGFYVADRGEKGIGVPPAACYAHIYIDGQLMNGTREPAEPFDVNYLTPDQIEGIEWYAGPGETPLEYSKLGSKCGVLVIWTKLKKK